MNHISDELEMNQNVRLLLQDGDVDGPLILPGIINDEQERFARIRCPHCRWRPTSYDQWWCASCPEPEGFYGGCGATWNTFDTGGLCPGCKHQWKWTSCLECEEWSLHMDWYSDSSD